MSDNKGVNAAGYAAAVYLWLKIGFSVVVLLGMVGCAALFMAGGK